MCLTNWFSKNRLSLNSDKIHAIRFNTDNSTLKHLSKEKYMTEDVVLNFYDF